MLADIISFFSHHKSMPINNISSTVPKTQEKKKLHIKKTLKFAPKKATFLNELLMLLSQRWLKTSKKRL